MRRTYDFEWFKIKWVTGYGWIFDRGPAVVVVPVDPDDRVWLVRVERIPTGESSWEIPGGGVDGSEDIVAAGLRELEEEGALVAHGGARVLSKSLELAPGMGRFPHHVVVASDVLPRGRRAIAQREEGIVAVRPFDRTSVRRMLRRGLLVSPTTIAALVVSGWLDGVHRRGSARRRRVNRRARPT